MLITGGPGSHGQEITEHMCVFFCMCMCMCVCVFGTPRTRSGLRAGSGQLGLAALAVLAPAPDSLVSTMEAPPQSLQVLTPVGGPGTRVPGQKER